MAIALVLPVEERQVRIPGHQERQPDLPEPIAAFLVLSVYQRGILTPP